MYVVQMHVGILKLNYIHSGFPYVSTNNVAILRDVKTKRGYIKCGYIQCTLMYSFLYFTSMKVSILLAEICRPLLYKLTPIYMRAIVDTNTVLYIFD